ncbi:MAG: response regulator transcription factor [Candidatus Korobacteraceae bacterium]
MRILVIEDDAALASYIRKGLESEHYAVDVALDGEQGSLMASDLDYDLMILDLNLPKLDGISVLRNVRPGKPQLPVLVLTARPRVEDRIFALDSGADDCVIKPFSYSELAARVRALLRRGRPSVNSVLQVADLTLDRVERKVQRGSRRIELTAKEFALLEYLMRNAGRRITRSMIIEHVWNLNFDTSTNVVDVYINYLRKKVDQDASCRLIHTIRGVGYELSESRDEGNEGEVA